MNPRIPAPEAGALPLGDSAIISNIIKFVLYWLPRKDLNPRIPAPEAGALPLGDSAATI